MEWTAPKAAPAGQQRPSASGNYYGYPTLRPTPPISGRSTPSVLQPNSKAPTNPPSRGNPPTPGSDSFANLVSFNASQSNKGLSLQEQQRKLQEENSRREAEKNRAFDSQFGSSKTSSWDTLEDGKTTPNRVTSPPTYTATSEYGGKKLSQVINKPFAGIPPVSASGVTPKPIGEDDDILAAFNASAPVDRSSHMPDQSRSSSIDPTNPFAKTQSFDAAQPLDDMSGLGRDLMEDWDDDPFGLGTSNTVQKSASKAIVVGTADDVKDDDDVLGLLGRPVSEFAKKPIFKPAAPEKVEADEGHPQERAVADLVDMGFARDKSRLALETTASGTDIQAAVGWLLNQAHEDARKKSSSEAQGDVEGRASKPPHRRSSAGRSSTSGAAKPVWMREQAQSNISQLRRDSNSPVNGEKDPAQYASEFGNKMFKTAGSLWKTGTKKLNQAVQDFSDSDSNQPKWMKEAPTETTARKPKMRQQQSGASDHDNMERTETSTRGTPVQDVNVTDEALMLEADSRPLRKPRAKAESSQDKVQQREQSSAFVAKPRDQIVSQPRFMQQAPVRDQKAKLSRQAVEEESSQAYISPARRKRPTPKTTVTAPEPESDLLFETSKPAPQSNDSRPAPPIRPRPAPTAPILCQNSPPKRNIPSLSSFALQASTKERQEGNSAFKRGDYAQATTHYSTSLSAIPADHPLRIVLLTNRALSHSKTGDAKASLTDAKSALELIGLTRGAHEVIDLGGGEGHKQMSIYWEKAMLRQAESLEQMERWSDAAAVWRACVEVGVGGATSIAGRNRTEKAAAPPSQPKPSTQKKTVVRSRPKPTALGDLAPDSESVTRLREANAAADRLDDEKLALADVVDARVSRWRAGKEGNLRALLSTLETVLWADSGWKKVGMGDVLMPGKVKLVYMKGIAKVHPDKVSIHVRCLAP